MFYYYICIYICNDYCSIEEKILHAILWGVLSFSEYIFYLFYFSFVILTNNLNL